MSGLLWRPSTEHIAQANLTAFKRAIEARAGVKLPDYAALHEFSTKQPETFWAFVWDFCDIIAETRATQVIRAPKRMPGARFFDDARLNFAENLLRRQDGAPAIIFWRKDRTSRTLTHADLYGQVSRLAQALRNIGVKSGDRIGAYLTKLPETVVAALAAASLGASWSSCSPDFGVRGAVDRFGQIEPKVLIGADGYIYNGKTHDRLRQLRDLLEQLPSIERLIVVPYTRDDLPVDDLRDASRWGEFLAAYEPSEIAFEQLPFNHPLYVLYSSGTTGPPKCIVHGAGGTLIQHLKEHQLHCDIHPGDRVFYFTTCGWMMWNWLVSALASQATILLYDGSPFYPNGRVLFDFADATGMTLFGTSAKFIEAVNKAGLLPIESHSLASVRTMTSTGSPLAPESFDFVYQKIKKDIHLASISGGTDIISCFVSGNPVGPVWRGEIQARALGMRVEVFDDHDRSVRGEKGELVCSAPFPSMPHRLLERPGRRQISCGVLRAVPRRLASGRLRGVDRARRDDHPRPLRRSPESRRSSNWHCRDLPAGRAAGPSRRECGDWPGV